MFFRAPNASKPKQSVRTESGNFFSDLSDHLPNYMLLIDNATGKKTNRPFIRIFSDKNKEKFYTMLQSVSWDMIFNQNDTNTAYNNFIEIITEAYKKSFPTTRLSRRRSKDKPWITKALKKVVVLKISCIRSG